MIGKRNEGQCNRQYLEGSISCGVRETENEKNQIDMNIRALMLGNSKDERVSLVAR